MIHFLIECLLILLHLILHCSEIEVVNLEDFNKFLVSRSTMSNDNKIIMVTRFYDYEGNSSSAITDMQDPERIIPARSLFWYDNEWGFTAIDLVKNLFNPMIFF